MMAPDALEALRRSEILKIFVVDADPETGEWLGEPSDTGQETDAWTWAMKDDTHAEHYDRYVYDDDTQAERAIILRWVE